MNIKIKKLHDDSIIPHYAHSSDAGMDLYSYESYSIQPHTTQLVHTGISIQLENGYEAQIRPRKWFSII